MSKYTNCKCEHCEYHRKEGKLEERERIIKIVEKAVNTIINCTKLMPSMITKDTVLSNLKVLKAINYDYGKEFEDGKK
jgi:hypothetical protein